MREHVDRFRYEVPDKKIATVTKKGVIRGKKAGFKGAPRAFFVIGFSYVQQKIKRILQNTRGVVHYKQLKHTNLIGKVVK